MQCYTTSPPGRARIMPDLTITLTKEAVYKIRKIYINALSIPV